MPRFSCSNIRNIFKFCFERRNNSNNSNCKISRNSILGRNSVIGKNLVNNNSIIKKNLEDGFRQVEVLGKGANSVVYKIIKNKKMFIKKVVSSRFKNCLVREKHVIKKLNQSHYSKTDFPVYIDSGNDGNSSWLITEYREGEDLFNWFNDITKIINEETIKQIFKEMVRLVNIMHKNGFVHLDIKMENFLLLKTKDNSIKLSLIDFDMAHIYYNEKVKLDKMVGTCGYCDYYIYKKIYSNKSDIWSLGVCLWILLEHRSPFDHDLKRNVLEKDDFIPKKYSRRVYKKYKNTAIPLIASILKIEHENRCSLDEIENNEWLNS